MSGQPRGPTDIRSVVLPIRAPVHCWFSSGAAAVGAPLACAFRQQCHHMCSALHLLLCPSPVLVYFARHHGYTPYKQQAKGRRPPCSVIVQRHAMPCTKSSPRLDWTDVENAALLRVACLGTCSYISLIGDASMHGLREDESGSVSCA